MARILITSGPTRQYLDPVRFLSNASSGKMGRSLAEAALELGHEVIIVSGPVDIDYPSAAQVVSVVSTEEMLAETQAVFANCDGLIGAAAPCDYRPYHVSEEKIRKTGQPLHVELRETDDVVATLARDKGPRWVVGFALETSDRRLRAIVKLEQKHCDLMVSNSPAAIAADTNQVEILDKAGNLLAELQGSKRKVARGILEVINTQFIQVE